MAEKDLSSEVSGNNTASKVINTVMGGLKDRTGNDTYASNANRPTKQKSNNVDDKGFVE